MPVGDNIRKVDYNTIQSRVAATLGTGSGNIGYGQTVQSSQVDETTRITVNEWGSLRNDIINIYRHQTDSIPNTTVLPEALEGQNVRYSVTNAPVTVWDTLSTTLQNNRVNALPLNRYGTVESGNSSATLTWTASAEISVTFTWSSAEQARFFFNSGGRLRLRTSLNSTTNTQQINDWESILNSVSWREFGGYFPNTGTSPIDGTNYFRTDSTLRTYFTQTVSATYSTNTYRLQASKSGATVTLKVLLTDAYTDPGNTPTDSPNTIDQVNGTLTLFVEYTYADGAMTGLGAATWNGYQPSTVSIGSWSAT